MRLGCGGCLGSLFVAGVLVGSVVGPIWLGYRLLQDPGVPAPPTSTSDGFRAQQKLYEVGKRAGRGGPIVLTDREISAFLSNHLAAAAELPLSGVVARMPGRGEAEIMGRLPLRHLLSEEPLATLREMLPAGSLDRPVWLRLRGDFTIEPAVTPAGRHALRFEVARFWIGRQRMPAVMLRLLVHPAALGVLRWPLPDGVEAVSVEPGRLVIRTAGEHSRNGAAGRK
jgi:hypothetical protein